MENKISFTSSVKEELTQNTYDSIERLRALLSAYIRINGSLLIRNKDTTLTLKSENAKIAKFLYTTINNIYSADTKLKMYSKNNLKKKTIYCIEIAHATETILEDLDISFLEGKISKNIVKNDDTISGYLAGAFLASGSVNSPSTSNYHLEITLNSENYAKWMAKLFARYKNSYIEPKIITRRDKYVLYFKKSDQISNFLIMIGAVSCCLEFEDVRANRDLINSANRLTNMDTANMKKMYETGKRQSYEIELIDKNLGIKNISNEKAKLLCSIRKENECASLNELASLMSIALGKEISKSNVNHLFRYLHSLFERLNK